ASVLAFAFLLSSRIPHTSFSRDWSSDVCSSDLGCLQDKNNFMQRTGGVIPYRLIYSLGEHPYLGYLLEPHIVWLNANGSLSLSYKRVFSNTVEEFADALEADDYKIIKLLDEIEQTHVIKRFHKKAIRPTDYFTRIFDQKIYDYIRPKLEEKMIKALALIGNKP